MQLFCAFSVYSSSPCLAILILVHGVPFVARVSNGPGFIAAVFFFPPFGQGSVSAPVLS